MRNMLWAVIIVVFAIGSSEGVFAQMDPYAGQVVLEEIRLMRQELAELHKEVAELRSEMKKKKPKSSSSNATMSFSSGSFSHRSADPQRLGEIELPELSDKEAVKVYIDEIMAASSGQNSWSSSDPQHRMLQAVGSDNVDLLLDALLKQGSHGPGGSYLADAVAVLAREENKERIIELLPVHKDLVEVIYKKGWQEDARDVLIEGLEGNADYVPTEWIKAVAELNDPETYGVLLDYLIYGQNRSHTYDAIEFLPGIDLSNSVALAWTEVQRGGRNDSYGRQSFADIAARYGHKDALEELVEMIQTADQSWTRDRARKSFFRVVDYHGSLANLAEWYDQHSDDLVFDAEEQQFVLKENK